MNKNGTVLTKLANGRYTAEAGRFRISKNTPACGGDGYYVTDTTRKDEHGFDYVVSYSASSLKAAAAFIRMYLRDLAKVQNS